MDKKTILLVEDNPDDEALTLRAFKRSTIRGEVVVARDGAEALNHLLGSGKVSGRDVTVALAVVLLDLKLPKVDGLEVLRRLRADDRTRLLPVVIVTSSKEESDIANSYKLGANSYVRKPVDSAKFEEGMQHLGLYWLGLNEPAPGGGSA
ncbi:MAG TPA: response regulator [Dehalococcoidia bacterium]|nr:response regulator [Dehalococcoidia bacterium]